MSDYVVHFTKQSESASAYDNMLSILHSGLLLPGGKFGAGRGLSVLGDSQRCVCFSEVPLGFLERLVERQSRYGIAFTQEFLSQRGGARVWYIDKDTPIYEVFNALKAQKLRSVDPADPFWQLTPFVDFPGDYRDTLYRFEWEREWRIPGEFGFKPEDVAFLFIPEELHDAARKFFAEAEADGRGPNYTCPFLDPLWDISEIERAMANVQGIDEPRDSHSESEGDADPETCRYRLVVEGLCMACGDFHE